MRMLEGLKKLYSGKEAFSRHLTLFSICGIAGLVDVYVTLEGMNSISLVNTFLYFAFCLLFALFITGYEIIFLNERELPDIDFRAFKHLLNKPVLIVVLVTCLIVFTKLFSPLVRIAFAVELLLAVPMTLIQAGYSYNYNPEEAFVLYKKISFKDYFVLLFKRLVLIFAGYAIVSILLFAIFFIIGAGIAISEHGDIQSIGLTISSIQFIVTKLSSFTTGIILVYVLTISALVWDYELIKTFED